MTDLVVASTREELAGARAALAGRVAVVMTMGALHDGHAQLMDVAHQHADRVIATIFVNPKQFGDGEDLDRYPRTLDADLQICRDHNVEVVFAPTIDEIYPADEKVPAIAAGSFATILEGAHRPGHFDGVVTVVSRLLDLTRPDVAVFGEKDAQQLEVIRRMVAEQGRAVEVVGVPTVREPDGLAMSSRNRYLSPEERKRALAVSRALLIGEVLGPEGADAVIAAVRERLAAERGIEIDYAEIVDSETWDAPNCRTRFGKILVAARVGGTRLIDNRDVRLGTPDGLKEQV